MPRGRLRALNPRKCQSIFRISGREAKTSSSRHLYKGSQNPGVLLPSQPRHARQPTNPRTHNFQAHFQQITLI